MCNCLNNYSFVYFVQFFSCDKFVTFNNFRVDESKLDIIQVTCDFNLVYQSSLAFLRLIYQSRGKFRNQRRVLSYKGGFVELNKVECYMLFTAHVNNGQYK